MPFGVDDAVALGLGLLGAGGQASTNKSNLKIAREQMRFQERMSSTAAQRSAEDYRLAGLNPALAYDRPASSPGGASTTFGDVAEAGISTALQAKQAKHQLELVAQQARAARAAADVANGPGVVRAQQTALRKEADARAGIAGISYENAFRDARHLEALQPIDRRIRAFEETLMKYSTEGLTREALSRVLPWLSSNIPKGMTPGRGPAMKFEEALPSRNPPGGFSLPRYRP